MDQEKINFSVVRDFSELFNATAKFFNQNFRHFFKSMIFIAGPLILVAAICMVIYFYTLTSVLPVPTYSSPAQNLAVLNNLGQMGWIMGLFIVSFAISHLLLITAVYAYMLVYSTHGPKNFSIADVRKATFQNFGRTLKGSVTMLFLALGVMIVFLLVVGLLAIILQIVAVFIVFIAFILFIPPLMWQLCVFYLVQMKEDVSALKAFGRTREVMRGNFFATWLYVFVAMIALIIISLIFTLPNTGLQLLTQAHLLTIPLSVLSCVMMVTQVFTMFVYCIFYFMCGIHYYSLAEKKDGTSLIDRIDEIGKVPFPDVEQH